MSGYIRQINSSDGTPITAPTTITLGVASYVVYANDAAYEAVHGAGSEGDAYFNSTDQQVRIYKNAAWEYHKADESVYDNATSGLSATDVQAAIDEVEARVDTAETNISTNTSNISANTSDIADIRTTQGTSDGDTNLGTFTGTTISDNGSVKAGMQELETAVEGKQADVITTRGDTIVGNASNVASRLPIGSSGFVLTSDGTDAAWAPATGGSGGGTGKNYILYPDAAVNATTGVTADAGFSVARTTTAAELAEESKGTAYLISGTGLSGGTSKIAYGILATGIDDADGKGRFGRVVCKVLDTSGAVNGDITIQGYDVDNSVYVGDSDTITGTGTYELDIPLRSGGDYEFHIIATGTDVSQFSISGITIEPVSQTTAGVIGKETSYSSTASWTNVTVDSYYTIEGQYAFVKGRITCTGTPSGSGLTITVPDHLPIDTTPTYLRSNNTYFGSYNNYDSSGGSQNQVGRINYLSATTVKFRQFSDNTTLEGLSDQTPTSGITYASGDEIDFEFRYKSSALANAHTPTASDVQYENSRARVYGDNLVLSSTPTIVTFNTEEYNTGGGFTYSSGQYTCNFNGFVSVKASLEAASGSGGVTMVAQIYKNTTSVAQGQLKDSAFTQVSDDVQVSVGDTLEIRASAPSGTPTLSTNQDGTYFTVSRISDYSARKASLPFPNGTVRLDTGNGHGSTNTAIRRFTNSSVTGNAFTYEDEQISIAGDGGAKIIVNRDMVASFTYSDGANAATQFGISVNASGTTAIASLSASDRLIMSVYGNSPTNFVSNCSVTVKLNRGDVIRPHTNTGPNLSNNTVQFVAQELYPLGN